MIYKSGAWNYSNINRTRNNTFDEGVANYICNLLGTNFTVLDFGCGIASYLKHIKDTIPNAEIIGIEPHISNNKNLEISKEDILSEDMSEVFDLNKRGNVMCIEVLEHIPPQFEKIAVENLIRHCNNYLIISWAKVGQNGNGHVNCKNFPEVCSLFESKGFSFLEKETIQIREAATLGWLKSNLSIFKIK